MSIIGSANILLICFIVLVVAIILYSIKAYKNKPQKSN